MVTAKKTPAASEAGTNTVAPVAKKARSSPAAKAVPPKTTATAKPVSRTPSAAAPADPSVSVEAQKVKKPKLVRDGFTIPKTEFQVLDELKLRAADLKHPTKKSELLRAGIKALAALDGAAFLAALRAVPAIKTGRPGKS